MGRFDFLYAAGLGIFIGRMAIVALIIFQPFIAFVIGAVGTIYQLGLNGVNKKRLFAAISSVFIFMDATLYLCDDIKVFNRHFIGMRVFNSRFLANGL